MMFFEAFSRANPSENAVCLAFRQALKEAKMVKSQVKKNQPQSAAAAIDAPETAPQNNTQYYEALIDAVNVILQCPTFVDLQTTAAPLPINTKPGEDQSGVQAGRFYSALAD